jgi:hypothetical protein
MRQESTAAYGTAATESVAKIVATQEAAGRYIALGYGMDFGWAIEGAIGSRIEIARLEAAVKQLQTPFLLSKEFVQKLSRPNRALSRPSTTWRSSVKLARAAAPKGPGGEPPTVAARGLSHLRPECFARKKNRHQHSHDL